MLFETVYEAAADMEIDTLVEALPAATGRSSAAPASGWKTASRSREHRTAKASSSRRSIVLRYGTQIVSAPSIHRAGQSNTGGWSICVTSHTATSAGKSRASWVTVSLPAACRLAWASSPSIRRSSCFAATSTCRVRWSGFAGDTAALRDDLSTLAGDDEGHSSLGAALSTSTTQSPPPAEDIR